MGITSFAVGGRVCVKNQKISKLKVLNLATFNLRRVYAGNG